MRDTIAGLLNGFRKTIFKIISDLLETITKAWAKANLGKNNIVKKKLNKSKFFTLTRRIKPYFA